MIVLMASRSFNKADEFADFADRFFGGRLSWQAYKAIFEYTQAGNPPFLRIAISEKEIDQWVEYASVAKAVATLKMSGPTICGKFKTIALKGRAILVKCGDHLNDEDDEDDDEDDEEEDCDE